MIHNDDYVRGVAKCLQGENLKATSYITHMGSLGAVRERMVGSFVRNETPERYRVETGLVRDHRRGETSRQCDLLVHEPGLSAPLYRMEDFVVVHDTAARAVVEVKSTLDKVNFDQMMDVHDSIIKIDFRSVGGFIPTFGYGISGVTFETFVTYLQDALARNRFGADREGLKALNWPVCIAVQDRNYFGIRPLSGPTNFLDCFCAVDFRRALDTAALPIDGIETGFFLQIYSEILREGKGSLGASDMYAWFNSLPIAPEGKVWLRLDGTATNGNIPIP